MFDATLKHAPVSLPPLLPLNASPMHIPHPEMTGLPVVQLVMTDEDKEGWGRILKKDTEVTSVVGS